VIEEEGEKKRKKLESIRASSYYSRRAEV